MDAVKALLGVIIISWMLYASTAYLLEDKDFYKHATNFAQMVLSISKVDLISAGADLPWSGTTYLIDLVVNTREAEDILARFGEITQKIDKDLLSKDNIQAQYDVVIKIRPEKQQCIYGEASGTRTYCVYALAVSDEFEWNPPSLPGSAEIQQKLRDHVYNDIKPNYPNYSLVGWNGKGYCKVEGVWPFQTVRCRGVVQVLFKMCSNRIGAAKLRLYSTYTQESIKVQAGTKQAEGEYEGKIATGQSVILKYGGQPVGKVDYVGQISTGYYCPDAPNYYIVNYGSGVKVIPATIYDAYEDRIIDSINKLPSECSYIQDWDAWNACVAKVKSNVNRINSIINNIRNWADNTIDGRPVEDPVPAEYRAGWYVAITPKRPVVFPRYRMYLKAAWVGILTKVINLDLLVEPSAISIVGPETKTLTVTVRNTSDFEGGATLEVSCTGGFTVEGRTEYSTGFTLGPGESKAVALDIGYGGGGTEPATGKCTVTVYPTADPSRKLSKTVSLRFTPKGEWPPNATVCIDSKTIAKTDEHGNLIPGTEKKCPEGYTCKQEGNTAKCEKELAPVEEEEKKEEQPSPITTLIAPLLMILAIIGLVFGLALG